MICGVVEVIRPEPAHPVAEPPQSSVPRLIRHRQAPSLGIHRDLHLGVGV